MKFDSEEHFEQKLQTSVTCVRFGASLAALPDKPIWTKEGTANFPLGVLLFSSTH
jgi:hypothetical protein